MVEFLRELPKIFRKRYLNTHARFLTAILNFVEYTYFPVGQYQPEDWKQACRQMLSTLSKTSTLSTRSDVGYETLHFRNLRNCWYHECSQYFPLNNIDLRLRFAAWKIIQCYYAVFSAIASLVCLEHPERKRHQDVVRIYLTDFVCNKNRRDHFLSPVNLHIDQTGVLSRKLTDSIDPYANLYCTPIIKECLEYAKREIEKVKGGKPVKERIGIPHYLRVLRDWTNYEDAYLFFRLYGPTVKEDLDLSLKWITFLHCVQTEVFLAKTFGWDVIRLQFETFAEELEVNLGITSPALEDRFEVYLEQPI